MAKKQKPHPITPTAELKTAFLSHYVQLCTIGKAAEAAGICRRTTQAWRDTDPDFKADFESAQQTVTEMLESEAIRRAYQGTEEPVFYKGEQCGQVRKFSDTLLIFLLKAADPARYRDRFEVTGQGGGPVLLRVVEDR